MKIAALISGGKDSIYTLCKMKDQGYEIVCGVYMYGENENSDSFMYQTIGQNIIKLIEQSLEIPFIYKKTRCITLNTNLKYSETKYDEVEDLYDALKTAQRKYQCNGVCSGAILSSYQKNRIENVCSRLGLQSFTPLWNLNQKVLLQEMIDYGIEAIIVKIASPLLKKIHLGKDICVIMEYFNSIESMNEINYAGEGGEYETITVNCKYFKYKLSCSLYNIKVHPEDINKNEIDQVMYIEFL